MSTIAIESPASTRQTLSTDAERTKFLRRVMREDGKGWTLHARESDGWQITFCRTIKGEPGDPDVDITVRIEDKITISGKYGMQRSFHDADEVMIPAPRRVYLSYGAVMTAAKFLLEGCHFTILGSSGSTSSSKHGLAFVSLEVFMKGGYDTVQVGDQSVYVHGKMVCCGSVE